MTKRKPTYEQALALEAGQAAARRAAKARARAVTPGQTDAERLAHWRRGSTKLLERLVRSGYTPSADKKAIRAVLAERNDAR